MDLPSPGGFVNIETRRSRYRDRIPASSRDFYPLYSAQTSSDVLAPAIKKQGRKAEVSPLFNVAL
jgi:hypothetical protein